MFPFKIQANRHTKQDFSQNVAKIIHGFSATEPSGKKRKAISCNIYLLKKKKLKINFAVVTI